MSPLGRFHCIQYHTSVLHTQSCTMCFSLCSAPHEPPCSDGDVRLVGRLASSEGLLEICVGGQYGTVDSRGWDLTDSAVVCRQLGLPLGL